MQARESFAILCFLAAGLLFPGIWLIDLFVWNLPIKEMVGPYRQEVFVSLVIGIIAPGFIGSFFHIFYTELPAWIWGPCWLSFIVCLSLLPIVMIHFVVGDDLGTTLLEQWLSKP